MKIVNMKVPYILLLGALWFTGCNILYPSTHFSNNEEGTHNATTTNNRSTTSNNETNNYVGTTAGNNSTASGTTNPPSHTANGTTSHTTTGTTSGTTSNAFDIPYSNSVGSKRSRDGLIAMWNFSDATASKIVDKGPHQPGMDLTGNADVARIPGRNGVKIDAKGHFKATSITRLFAEITSTNAFTIETWITPASLTQRGPARIVTFSIGSYNRNFTLGQDGSDLVFLLRTQDSDDALSRHNGKPELRIKNTVFLRPIHCVVTYDGSMLSMWIDGNKLGSLPLPGGLLGWEPTYEFRIGDEFGDNRNWKGNMHFLSIYNRALRPEEIAHHHALGSSTDPEVPQNADPIHVQYCEMWPFELMDDQSFTLFHQHQCKKVVGDVFVKSNADAMHLTSVVEIMGDLIIENIDHLPLLPNLHTIRGRLIIKHTRLPNLDGLASLSNVGKSLVISHNERLLTLNGLNGLSRINNDLVITHNRSLTSLDGLQNIDRITQFFVISDANSLQSIEMPALRVSHYLAMSRIPLQTIDFSNLVVLHVLFAHDMPQLNTLTLNAEAKDVRIVNNAQLRTLHFESSPKTNFLIINNKNLQDLSSLSNLSRVNNFVLKQNGLMRVKLNGLRTIHGDLIITHSNLRSLDNEFPLLTKITGVFDISDNYNLSTFNLAFPKLASTGALIVNQNTMLQNISRGFASLTSTDFMQINRNPQLPQCDADALATRANAVMFNFSGNDEFTDCP